MLPNIIAAWVGGCQRGGKDLERKSEGVQHAQSEPQLQYELENPQNFINSSDASMPVHQ